MLSTHVEILESIGRLSVALALGSVIGVERQWRQKMAGLRTNALVALGSCGFVVLSAMVGEGDPTRVAAQVVTGIGFLGAALFCGRESTCTDSTRQRPCGVRRWWALSSAPVFGHQAWWLPGL
jgi:putative Mg2+ transporter-C (MgtC) family protein